MATLLYYCILLPVSKLPLRIIYGISRVFYVLAYRVFGYRTKVVRTNIRASFPDWSEAEVDGQVEKFYRYFFDSVAESIKLFSMSEEESIERCRVVNPELIAPYAEANRSVMVVGAHYANWEIAALSFPLIFERQTVMGIYSPLKNEAMDTLVRENRQRTGVHLVSRRVVDEYYEEDPVRPSIDFFVADQSPSNHVWQKIHWTTFLNQTTGFLAGPERYAVRNNIPVFYMNLRIINRGHYAAELTPITLHPRETSPGAITEAFARTLEQEILRNPTPWLWTHRRWKRDVPEEVTQLLKEQSFVGPEYSR
ncbi:lysophospholipid acyltransferase family protein [Neolewinella antarctica]|uniref:KDO2-lipid IV(A) lauroyltransferase n=1 Tax=Neolewinella antarctica TaxID=442734 RepID=A0ABX0XC16_9BACT|nr:lysophospholipid acyltransferase family protein [Neolewinella antarctica]NJC26742.1 KDO2-lipid IV(A) lauroyltransferase [Neolewinella antarctica]